MHKTDKLFQRRQNRVRSKIKRINKTHKPRLSVFRSGVHIYAQIIDDANHVTLACASTIEKDARSAVKTTSNKEAASKVGEMLAQRATKNGISEVVFDKSGYAYHGRVKELAEAARNNGLKF